ELDTQGVLADGRVDDRGVSGQVRRGLRARNGQRRRKVSRSVPATGDTYFPEEGGGAGGGIAECGHAKCVLGRQRCERRQQAGIHLTGPELRRISRGELEPPVPEQLRSRGSAGGEISPQRGLVSGWSAGFRRADVDPGVTRTETRD